MKQHVITGLIVIGVLAVLFRTPSVRDAVIGEDPLAKAKA
jgi:hypothetical protein